MRKSADAQKMDKKHVSPESLGMMLQGKMQDALQRPDMQFLLAQAKERRRTLRDALKWPDFYRKPPGTRPATPQLNSQFSPVPPGTPQAPGDPQAGPSLSGMQPAAGLLNYFMTKMSDEGKAETAEEEATEQALAPEQVQDLVNFIVARGKGIDDDEFHAQAEGLGVEPHEAEEEMYRLIADLVGGKNDLVAGGKAQGMPASAFPKQDLAAGTKVEMEHTPNPAIATEIAKDHHVEVDDYYTGKGRLGDMEKKVEKDKDAGKAKGVEPEKKAAFKYGFFKKLAEMGMKPSEFEEIFRASFEKTSAEGMGLGTGLAAGSIGSKLLELLGGGITAVGRTALGAGKLGLAAPLLMAPIVGAIGGGSLYYMSRSKELTPGDIHHLERIALYKRLARRAKRRTRSAQTEGASVETRGDDAHRKILPMPTSAGVEI